MTESILGDPTIGSLSIDGVSRLMRRSGYRSQSPAGAHCIRKAALFPGMRPSISCIRATLVVTLLMCAAHELASQVVRGTVLDATSGMPVGTGFLILLDADSAEVARALWSQDGRYSLRAPHGGKYRLRSERIGYRAFVTDVLDIPDTGVRDHDLSIIALPVKLNAVAVQGRDRCQVNPERAAETALVWEEIRKALAAMAWEGNEQLYHFRRYDYVREMNRDGSEIRGEEGRIGEGVATQPYVSLPAAQLAQHGYVVRREDELWYYMPDVHALQDDAFLNTHCFYVVREPEEHAGLVGLAFEPMSGRDRTEVRGALWIDEATSALRTMELGFTEIPGRVTDERIGGTIEFMQLPSGAWIVQRWEIRTPVLRWRGSDDPAIRTRRDRAAISYFLDSGGEILEITARDGSKTYPATLAHLTGSIYDSTKAETIGGVTVTITGTGFWATTDDSGEFYLAVPLEGDYAVTFSHPWLDSIGYHAPEERLSLTRGLNHPVSFHVPTAATMIVRLCGDAASQMDGKVIIGVVEGEDGDSVADAEVTASWQQVVPTENGFVSQDFSRSAVSDESGFFAVCDLPHGRPLAVRAERRRRRSGTAEVIFPWTVGGNLLLARDRESGDPYQHSYSGLHSIWKMDFRLADEDDSRSRVATGSVLRGMVADRMTGRGLEEVTVSLNGGVTTGTRADGIFDLVGVNWLAGTNTVSFRRLGYRPWVQELELEEDRSELVMSVLLTSLAITMDPVVVEAERVRRSRYLENAGFYRRQEKGFGYHVSPERVEERRAEISNVGDLLTGIPGVTVMDLPEPIDGITGRLLMLGYGEGRCIPRLYVDGSPFAYDGTVAMLETIARPEDLYAIEIYRRASETPVEYSVAGDGCVIVVWTRRGAGGQ